MAGRQQATGRGTAGGPSASTGAGPDASAGPGADASAGPGAGEATAAGADEFAGLSYEQARDALSDVVRRLEGGAETLEESLALWERGEALARHCEQWLAGAQARLNADQTSPSGD